MSRTSSIRAAVAVGGMFFAFAGDGLRSYFASDNMREIYVAWTATPAQLLHHDRPVGALVYRCLFPLFGLNPLPFHLVSFAFLLANLALLYCFCLSLSKSREASALACLVGAYHAHLADLYYSVSTIFDLLCYFFVLLALIYYAGIRAKGVYPNWRQNLALLALYCGALGSKEMAVVLPVFVVFYELIYHGPKIGTERLRGAGFLWLSVPITAGYLRVKTAGAAALAANPDYHPHFSIHVYLDGWKHYLNDLFYRTIAFNHFKIVMLLVLMLAFAAVARRRELLFAWSVAVVGALPFLFITPRGFYVMYLTLPGWYLYAGSTLVRIRDSLPRRLPAWSLFLLVAATLIPLHRREKTPGMEVLARDQRMVRSVLEPLDSRHIVLRKGARVLFLSDPYDADDYILYFMFSLHYRDREIRVDRVRNDPALAEAPRAPYDRVFTLDSGGLKEVAE